MNKPLDLIRQRVKKSKQSQGSKIAGAAGNCGWSPTDRLLDHGLRGSGSSGPEKDV